MLHKNQFVRFVTLGIIVLCLTATGCATKKAIWGDPQTGFILNYDIPQDKSLNYKSSSGATQNMDAMGQSIEISTKTNSEYAIKGTGTDEQNNITTQITINNLDINMTTPQGPNTPDTSALKGKSFGLSFSPKGKEIKFTGADDLKINLGQMGGGEQSVKSNFSDVLPDLPDEPVKIGGTWAKPVDQKTQQGPIELVIKGEAVNTLEGVETIKGMECAKIVTRTKSTVEGSGEQMGQKIELKGNTESTSTWYFAFKKGLFIKASADTSSNMKINLGTMEIPQTTKSKSETELVL